MDGFRAACIQTNSGPDIEANLRAVTPLIDSAADRGAQFVALPENVALMESGRQRILAKSYSEDIHPALAAFRDLAARHGIWLLVGSLGIRVGEEEKIANRSYLLDTGGRITAAYDKIHMFDVELSEGESYRESATFQPGKMAVLASLPWGPLGMSVCYDLRFPYLYRGLALAGAVFLSVPSAFTRVTGRAHWHVLLQARAIENGCYVFAPAQCGIHAGGRETYGHSLIVDPWGKIVAEASPDMPEVVLADIDPSEVTAARRRLPSLSHGREVHLSGREE